MVSVKLSIVIPSYQIKAHALPGPFWDVWLSLIVEFDWIDWIVIESYQHTDKTELLDWLQNKNIPQLQLLSLMQDVPNRAGAFNIAISKSKGDMVALFHEDCLVVKSDFQKMQHQITNQSLITWGGFHKQYDNNHILLLLSAMFQNRCRFPKGKLVGSNGFVFPRFFWEKHPFKEEFLEDLTFSKTAFKELGPPKCFGSITVSGRRYLARGVFRCLCKNWIILLGFYLGIKSKKLKLLYPTKE